MSSNSYLTVQQQGNCLQLFKPIRNRFPQAPPPPPPIPPSPQVTLKPYITLKYFWLCQTLNTAYNEAGGRLVSRLTPKAISVYLPAYATQLQYNSCVLSTSPCTAMTQCVLSISPCTATTVYFPSHLVQQGHSVYFPSHLVQYS